MKKDPQAVGSGSSGGDSNSKLQPSATAPSVPTPIQLSPADRRDRAYSKVERISMVSVPGKRNSAMERVQLIGGRRLTQAAQDPSSPIKMFQRPAGRPENKEEDDDAKSDENEPKNPSLQKAKARRRILYHLWKGNYERAKQYAEEQYAKARGGLDKAENDVEYSAGHLDDIMQDFLMYAKCLMLSEGSDLTIVREILHILSENILNCIKINYREVKNSMTEEGGGVSPDTKKSYRDFDSYSMSGKTKSVNMHKRVDASDFSDFKRILHMHGIIAAFYKQLENQVECEKTYAKYCKIVEKLFGIQTVETSNCYYYIGIYYYEEQQYEKALICMKKSLFNRARELGERHIACGDCHFNIGIIYKRLNQFAKAKTELEQALSIRREGIGRSSLPCAAVLEELGKLCLEGGDYKSAFLHLQECYEIRKKLIKNAKDIEITRVSLLLIFLNRQIEKELGKNTEKDRRQYERNARLTSALARAYPSSSPIQQQSIPEEVASQRENVPTAPPTGHEILEADNYSPEEPARKSLGASEFASKRLQQIFEYHSEGPSGEAIIDVFVFLLSLDKMQMEYLNNMQVDWQGNSPLFVSKEFRDKLSQYQLYLLSRADILRTPRRLFLKKPEEVVALENLQLSEQTLGNKLLRVKDDATLSEKNIYTLLKSSSDFYKVLNNWQVEILNKVTAMRLPLGLFIRCIQENQITMFEARVEQELRALQEHDAAKDSYRQLPLFYKTADRTYNKELLAISPKLDMQDELIGFVDKKFLPQMLSQLVLDINEEFCKNLDHEQMMLISQLTMTKHALASGADSLKKDEREWTRFVKQLKEFIKSLNQKEAYQFALVNSFMLGVTPEQLEFAPVPVSASMTDEEAKARPQINEKQQKKPVSPVKEEEKKRPASNRVGFGGPDSEGEDSSEGDESGTVKEQDDSELLINILQNQSVLEEMKRALPKKSLKTISDHPEIMRHFLTKVPNSFESGQAADFREPDLRPDNSASAHGSGNQQQM